MADERKLSVSSMRDPAHPAGAITVDDLSKPLPVNTQTGSRYFSGQIGGKWYVLNAHMEKALQTAFDTEQEALDRAAEKNGMSDDEKPEIEGSR